MDPSIPPSPAPSNDEFLPSGFRQLQQHNATTSYPHSTMDATGLGISSQPVSRYGTPVPQASSTPTYEMGYPQLYRSHYVRLCRASGGRVANKRHSKRISLCILMKEVRTDRSQMRCSQW